MTILTLTPTLLDEILDRSSALSLLVSIQSASSLLQSVTHQLILCRPKKHSMKRSSNDVIRWETRTIVDIVQTVESLVTGGIMLNDHQVKTLIWNSTKGFRSSFLWWYQSFMPSTSLWWPMLINSWMPYWLSSIRLYIA